METQSRPSDKILDRRFWIYEPLERCYDLNETNMTREQVKPRTIAAVGKMGKHCSAQSQILNPKS